MNNRTSVNLTRAGSMALWLLTVVICAWWAVPANSQSRKPKTFDADLPYESLAPWWNRSHTEVEDEVLLRGTLHLTAKVWSTSTGIERIVIHLNAVDIHGTSETTGQRFRLNGAFSLDQRDPDVTLNPDGVFVFPFKFPLRLHKVDPEIGRVDGYVQGSGSFSASYMERVDAPPVFCRRVYQPDGQPSPTVDCGSFRFGSVVLPVVKDNRVFVTSGATCPGGGQLCEVPDGATLFNGFEGDYIPPLIMRGRVWNWTGAINDITLRWHCNTGNWEAPVLSIGGGEFVRCSPLYSSIMPITVYAEVSYRSYMPTSDGLYGFQTFIVREAPHVFHMLERTGAEQARYYDDKASFLAATGAVNATGPLPNLGLVADSSNPNASATIGSVTLSLAPGGDNMFIGGLAIVSDWYPQRPGNEIALGFERFQVRTAAPVYALGFEVIEPHTTMPSWGGTPVDSTYVVTLFAGDAQVGQFTFNVSDDVVAFVGVWSTTAFDRIVIIDTSDSDDDEYFGEFFTGTTPLP